RTFVWINRMNNKFYFLITFVLFITKINGQTVQAGISSFITENDTFLVISAKPDQDIIGNLSGGNITIIWPTNYNITLGNIIQPLGSPWFLNKLGTFNDTIAFANYALASGVFAINWSNGSINELFRIVVNQRNQMPYTGTFVLSNDIPDATGNWYCEIGGIDYTNNDFPFFNPIVSGVPLPVELNNFVAKKNSHSVELHWSTVTEINNRVFEIHRKPKKTNNWEKIGFVKGNGNSNSPKEYSFVDKNPTGGTKFIYRLKQIDNDGTFAYSDEVEVELISDKFELYQNYPNPFNPSTNIKFSLPAASLVRIDIYNIIGEHIRTLVNSEMEAGYHNVVFDASDLSSGTYIYRISTPNFTQTKKMLLLK